MSEGGVARSRRGGRELEPGSTSIVIPVFNEEHNIEMLWVEIRTALSPLARCWEVVFVDDGSTDGGLGILRELAEADSRIRVLRLRMNCGQSAALAAGFRAARGEVIVTLDSDLQNDPADITKLLAELEGCDVVSGVRAERKDTWVRRASSDVANRVRRLVTGDSITDIGCSLKAYRVDWLERIPWFNGMHRFLPALVQMEGGRVTQVVVRHRPRLHGRSKYSINNRLWRGLSDLLAMRWFRSRRIDRGLEEEVTICRNPRGCGSVSPVKAYSARDSSSSGLPPNDRARAWSRGPSGS